MVGQYPGRLARAAAVMAAACLPLYSAGAQDIDIPPGLGKLTLEDMRESMIAFVNLSTAPGLDGATFRVNEDYRESDLVRGSLGYAADLTLKGSVMDAYWGVALAYGSLEDRLEALGEAGEPLRLSVDRDILSLRGSAGLSLPINRYFKLRPFVSLAASRLESSSSLTHLGEITPPSLVWLDSEVDALTTSGTLFADYDRWYEDHRRVELRGQYTLAYTDTFNGSSDTLDTWGWNETLFLRARYSLPTGWHTRGKPWRWNGYVSHTRFLGLEQRALGFNAFSELGLGLDFEVNIRPLDWFGLRFVGFKAGYIFGDGVEGVSVGLTF